MQSAGDYSDHCQLLKRTLTKDPATGQDVEAFPANGYLWCAVEINSARRQESLGASQTGVAATIRIRNYVTVSALDRLYLAEWGETWILETIRRGDNELIAEAHRFDDLVI